jgi:cytidylate kinase
MGPLVIAIGGPHGSGKSSVAERLAKELEMNYVSAGQVFRQMAHERGYSLREFSKIVIEEPQVDREIDLRTKELGSQDNTIVDAQLAAYFTPDDIPLKICITASFDIRCERIAKRENISTENARAETSIRESAEKKRFHDLYQINVDDLSVYDIVINNDRLSLEETYQLSKTVVKFVIKNN